MELRHPYLNCFGHGLYKVIRIILSLIFVWSGITKLIDLLGFALIIDKYGLIPEATVLPVAMIIIFFELAAGVGLIFDVQWSLGIITVMLIAFIVILSYGLWIGLDLGCGCFGKIESSQSMRSAILRDILMLAGISYLIAWRSCKSLRLVKTRRTLIYSVGSILFFILIINQALGIGDFFFTKRKGIAYMENGQFKKAVTELEKVSEHIDPEVQLSLIECYLSAKDIGISFGDEVATEKSNALISNPKYKKYENLSDQIASIYIENLDNVSSVYITYDRLLKADRYATSLENKRILGLLAKALSNHFKDDKYYRNLLMIATKNLYDDQIRN
ncbi:MAG TPA: MauE/DoxX family redox-associated membrane protein [Desulfobacteraceae bacterium]|nr:MauE/DoxX family redox-associated membrane protein [Desulfobacteraceae bacterium]HPJ68828.1 MauE/DoxX family redox-associated membrane protein [Desulfobacteraceae bacterium]HPQ26900.1 MauE/DoxX family redox-associated membrane protein [Desulfobacteraceae bacterium]